jgi:hypothetical protein
MPEITRIDKALAKQIENEMFKFEHLFVLDPHRWARCCAKWTTIPLIDALKGIAEDEREVFFRAMSSRAADGVQGRDRRARPGQAGRCRRGAEGDRRPPAARRRRRDRVRRRRRRICLSLRAALADLAAAKPSLGARRRMDSAATALCRRRRSSAAAGPGAEETEPEDPLAEAWAEGFAAGAEQARRQEAEGSLPPTAPRARAWRFPCPARCAMQEGAAPAPARYGRGAVRSAMRAARARSDALMRRIERAVAMLARATMTRHPPAPRRSGACCPRLPADWRSCPTPRWNAVRCASEGRAAASRTARPVAPRHRRGAQPVLRPASRPSWPIFPPVPLDLTPRRYGLVAACDGGLLEVSGLSVPVGALCRVAHGRGETLTAEVIGFRNGRTLMMLLGDSVMLRPGARVAPKAAPACCRWARHSWAARSMARACRSMAGADPRPREWPAGGIRTAALDRSPVRERFDTGVRALNALTTSASASASASWPDRASASRSCST